MHITGLLGMPRRVYTYPAELGWDGLNLTSTVGAFVIAAGVMIFPLDLVRNFRQFTGDSAGDVGEAGTPEWMPSGLYQTRSIHIVDSRHPLGDPPPSARAGRPA